MIVGDHRRILIPVLAREQGGGRLKGLRCVHTHLAGEGISDDDLMDLLFLRLDLMAVLTMNEEGLPEKIHPVHLLPQPVDGKNWRFLPAVHPARLPATFLDTITALEEEFARARAGREVGRGEDRAILVSVTTASRQAAEESMAELVELARSDNVTVLDTVIQRRAAIHPKWIMGKGKLAEIMLAALTLNANLLIFDQELNPSQIRSVTDSTEMRVIDRTQLILDIFARRARSREGKLQIEMAQLRYMLPRLGSRDDALSRLTGGIGGRGPGETRLEIDRRRISDRLARLADKLKGVARERHYRRSRRRKKSLPVLSLVGYTNAGKSTLLNTLTKSGVVAEDKLFATLDPTSRRLRFPEDIEVIMTDTVGFIRNLPEELIKAFRSTLEELHEADLLIHVIDASSPWVHDQVAVVENLLAEMDLDGIPLLRVLNKKDRISAEQERLLSEELGGIPVSALDADSLNPLLERARQLVADKWRAIAENGDDGIHADGEAEADDRWPAG
ncbi:MAG: GTPase HflX [Thermodesulfobacteriota bacterium]